MTRQELALELTRVVNKARPGERWLMAALFGIKHHGLLTGQGVAEILGLAKLQSEPINYEVAINRGRELAKYVDLKSGQHRAQAEFTGDMDVVAAS